MSVDRIEKDIRIAASVEQGMPASNPTPKDGLFTLMRFSVAPRSSP